MQIVVDKEDDEHADVIEEPQGPECGLVKLPGYEAPIMFNFPDSCREVVQGGSNLHRKRQNMMQDQASTAAQSTSNL